MQGTNVDRAFIWEVACESVYLIRIIRRIEDDFVKKCCNFFFVTKKNKKKIIFRRDSNSDFLTKFLTFTFHSPLSIMFQYQTIKILCFIFNFVFFQKLFISLSTPFHNYFFAKTPSNSNKNCEEGHNRQNICLLLFFGFSHNQTAQKIASQTRWWSKGL